MNAFKNFPTTTLLLGLGLLFAHPESILAQFTTDTQPAPVVAAPKQHDLLATVASYRDDVRQSVLLASQQPQVLTQLAQQQAQTQRAFADLMKRLTVRPSRAGFTT